MRERERLGVGSETASPKIKASICLTRHSAPVICEADSAPSLWAKLLEEIRLGHSSAERGDEPGPVGTVCDGARQLLLQRPPTEGCYQ